MRAPRAAWRASDAVVSDRNIVAIPDSTGNGHDLEPTTIGDATFTPHNPSFGEHATATRTAWPDSSTRGPRST